MLTGMKSYIRILIVVVGIVLVGLVLWKVLPRSSSTNLAASPTPSGSIVPLASVSPLVIAYDAAPSDWKTYSSASMGFSVSYPSDWRFGSCGIQCVAWAPTSAAEGQFALGIIKSTGTLADLLTKAQPYLANKQTVTAGSNSWLKLTLQQPTTGEIVTSHFIAHGTNLFEFGIATSDASTIAVYGKMLSSFKFLK
jgi:hypothetical protein